MVHDSGGSGTVYTPGFAHWQGSMDRFVHDGWLGSTRHLSDSGGSSLPSALRFDAFRNRRATGGSDPYNPGDFQFAAGAGWSSAGWSR